MKHVIRFYAIWLAVGCALASPLAHAVAQIESGGNPAAVGDGGKARGLHQFHKELWDETTAIRKAAGLKTWPWSKAFLAEASTAYAATALNSIAARLKSELGRPATTAEIYAVWNLGWTGFKNRDFDVKRCPASTRNAIARL